LTNLSQNALSYYWDFGDGEISLLENPTHIYSSEGGYNLTLIAENDCSSDTLTVSILVCQSPIPDFDYTCHHLKVSFSNLSVNYSSCIWDFGDGNGSILDNPEHIYSEAGQYVIKLTVMRNCVNDSLISNELSQQIMIPCSPTASFDYEIKEMEVTFINSSSNALSFWWDFGDGYTSVLTDPVHNYSKIGSYEVTLLAINDHGTDTVESVIDITSIQEIYGKNPISIFPNPTTGKIYLKINNNSINTIHYELSNMHGQLLIKDKIKPDNSITELDISTLPPGIYLFRIKNMGFSLTNKLIIY